MITRMKEEGAAISRWPPQLVIPLMLTAVLLGCGGGQGPGSMDGSASVIRVTVQNDDFRDAVIYANWQGSTRRRMGMATGKASNTFSTQWQASVVQLEAHFIAGGTVLSEPIQVWEGDRLEIVLTNEVPEIVLVDKTFR